MENIAQQNNCLRNESLSLSFLAEKDVDNMLKVTNAMNAKVLNLLQLRSWNVMTQLF